MEEALKWIAGGGSFGTLLAIFYIYRIEPRLRSLELTILQGQKIELIRLTKTITLHPDLHESAMNVMTDVDKKLEGLKSA
jgi:hypothetical protein